MSKHQLSPTVGVNIYQLRQQQLPPQASYMQYHRMQTQQQQQLHQQPCVQGQGQHQQMGLQLGAGHFDYTTMSTTVNPTHQQHLELDQFQQIEHVQQIKQRYTERVQWNHPPQQQQQQVQQQNVQKASERMQHWQPPRQQLSGHKKQQQQRGFGLLDTNTSDHINDITESEISLSKTDRAAWSREIVLKPEVNQIVSKRPHETNTPTTYSLPTLTAECEQRANALSHSGTEPRQNIEQHSELTQMI